MSPRKVANSASRRCGARALGWLENGMLLGVMDTGELGVEADEDMVLCDEEPNRRRVELKSRDGRRREEEY